jgi:hypothetical protein
MGNDIPKQRNLQTHNNRNPIRQQAFAQKNVIYMSGPKKKRSNTGPTSSYGLMGPNSSTSTYGSSGPTGYSGPSGPSGPSGCTGMNNYIYSSSIKGYMIDDGINKPYGMIEQVSCDNGDQPYRKTGVERYHENGVQPYHDNGAPNYDYDGVKPYCEEHVCVHQPYLIGYDTWKKQAKYTT